MKQLFKLLSGSVLFACGFAAQAQFSAPGGFPPGFHHALLDVFSGQPPFSGRANVQLDNGAGQDPTTISCDIAYSAGRMRVDADAFAAGTNMPAAEAAKLKDMHSTTIVRPDRNRMYMVFPQFSSYVEVASFGKVTAETVPAPAPVIGKTPLGPETLGAARCDKSQWNVTEMNGEHYDLTVWKATNLNNFPIQIRVGPPAALVTFQNWRMEAPDVSLFEPPTTYMKYEGIQELILKDTQKAGITNVP